MKQRMLAGLYPWLCCACLAVTALSVGAFDKKPVSTQTGFVLRILAENYESLHLGYTWDSAWPVLSKTNAYTTSAEITLTDVAHYDWTKQTLVLTPKASRALNARFKIRKDTDLAAQFGIGHRAFVVRLDGVPVYGGVFLEPQSPMAIKYPVINLNTTKDGCWRLTLRPMNTVGDAVIKLKADDPIWERIRREEIRAAFEKANKLTR